MNLSRYFIYVLVLFLFWQTSYCPTSVYISNNTPFELKLSVHVTGDEQLEFGEHYEVRATVIKPWSREVFLELNRHELPGDVLKKVKYYFSTAVEVYNDGEYLQMPILLEQVLKVPSVGMVSTMKYGVFKEGYPGTLEKGLVELDWQEDGRNVDVYCDDYLAGMFHDVEYAFSIRPFSGATFDERENILHVLHYNVWMRPLIAFPYDGQKARAKMIPPMIPGFFQEFKPDIVEFNEVFSTEAEKKLRKGMALEGYTYSTEVIGKSAAEIDEISEKIEEKTPSLGNGGVILFSHWPIEEWDEVSYSDCYAEDCIAAKGALYAVIVKNDMRYHLFATHVQADTGDIESCKETREKQFKVLRAFIDHQINQGKIRDDEPIIIMGDFNVKQDDKLEYEKTMKELRVIHPENRGYPYSYEGEAAVLDYIVFDKNYLHPQHAFLDVMKTRSQLPWTSGGSNLELRFWPSDHYPVYGYFEF